MQKALLTSLHERPFYFLYSFHLLYHFNQLHVGPLMLQLLAGNLFIYYLFRSLEIVIKKRFLFKVATSFVIVFFTMNYLFYYRMNSILSYQLLSNNFFEIFNEDAQQLIWDTLTDLDLLNLTFLFIAFCFFLFFIKNVKPSQLNYPKKAIFLTIGFPLIVVLINGIPYEMGANFLRTVYLSFRPIQWDLLDTYDETASKKTYELLSHFETNKKPRSVIVVAMESFNQRFVLEKGPNGQDFTPTFNALVDQGLYFDNFYSHSIQTAKGHFSLLCGRLPMFKDKAMLYTHLKVKCLPQILQEKKYQTVFFQGQQDDDFDNTKNFMLAHGFDEFHHTDTTTLAKEQYAKKFWGWGPTDDLTYAQAIEMADKRLEQHPDKPLFMFIATISNHMNFRYVPKELRSHYKKPQNHYEYFANSITVADLFLKTLIESIESSSHLQDAIIIITGDHGFPSGVHGQTFPDQKIYNEMHRIPLLILAPGILKPRISNQLASQYRLASTLLDLIGHNGPLPFEGHSLFDQNIQPVFLIQPYDGIYLSVIHDNLKYVEHWSSGTNSLFDLTSDPEESKNIIELLPQEKSYYLQYLLQDIIKNEAYLQSKIN